MKIINAKREKDGQITGECVIDGERKLFMFSESDNHPLADRFREALNGVEIAPYIPSELEILTEEKERLLKLLSDTDYKAIKATENGGSLAEINPQLALERQAARDRINAIDARLSELEEESGEYA